MCGITITSWDCKLIDIFRLGIWNQLPYVFRWSNMKVSLLIFPICAWTWKFQNPHKRFKGNPYNHFQVKKRMPISFMWLFTLKSWRICTVFIPAYWRSCNFVFSEDSWQQVAQPHEANLHQISSMSPPPILLLMFEV